MKYLKLMIAGFIVSMSIVACNSDSSSSTTTADTSKAAMAADSSMKDSAAKSASAKKKKLKASLGEMDKAAPTKKYTKDKSGVYDNAEVMPAFKGGQSALDSYVNNNLTAPQPAIDDSKEGTIRVMFAVDETGKVMNAHTMGAKLGDGLDEEAMRVLSSMPKWEPGTIGGKPVKVWLTLPIVFKAEAE